MSCDSQRPLPRRSFFSRLGSAAAAAGAAVGFTSSDAHASTQAAPEGRWQPARHEQDDWLEKIPGKHRLFFDAPTPESLADALMFANNVFTGNKEGYGLEANEQAIVICMRHFAAGYGFSDAMWAKHGVSLAPAGGTADPKADPKADAAVVNRHTAAIVRLAGRGVHFAVCNLSARRIAGMIARRTGGKQDEFYTELSTNMVPNSRLVPAGIVAVNRAQERGYSLA